MAYLTGCPPDRWSLGGPLILFLAFVAASCSTNGSAAKDLPGSDIASEILSGMDDQLSCANSIETLSDPPERFVVGPLPVIAFVDAQVHRRGRQGTDNDPDSARKFAKIAIAARNGSQFTMLLHADSQGNALLDYGQGQFVTEFAVTVQACDDPTGSWSVYPGGIWTLEPGYVTLIVQDDHTGAVANVDLCMAP